MSFNELNSVEHFIIHKLTGVNLNNMQSGMVAEDAVEYDPVDHILNKFGGEIIPE